jgi:hypothetical protein
MKVIQSMQAQAAPTGAMQFRKSALTINNEASGQPFIASYFFHFAFS